ncbi:MAG: guanine deaminase, partial [Lachnospiraceae bacterium]|nr:guanine deaminase [Lachnospiraceae bacterium]
MTFEKAFALKGNIVFAPDYNKMEIHENSYLVCENGAVKNITKEAPENITVYDMGNKIIIPGMTDLHLHAPQYTYRATGMDLELLDWLESSAFPEEARYSDNEYAKKAYSIFTEDLVKSPTTRAVIFATVHKDATLILMDMLEKSGLITMVGKV